MDCVLQPFGEPIPGKGNEDKQANNLCVAASTLSAGGVVRTGIVTHVDCNKGHGVVGSKGGRDHSSESTHKPHMTMMLGDINGCLEHKSAEGDTGDPRPKCQDREGDENEEDDASAIILPRKHIDGRHQAENDVENAGDPDELLGKQARNGDV